MRSAPTRPAAAAARPSRLRRVLNLTVANIAGTLLLFFAIDLVISSTSLVYRLIPDSFRVYDPRIHHTLVPNVANGISVWGPRRRPYATNSLGFRDDRVRDVPLHADKPRVLFIGDSFTEGEGLAWDKTFVGLFQERFPKIDVLNAAVSSYSPSIYWTKIAALLDRGLVVDYVFVYIDISDVQDEAMYKFDDQGNVVDSDVVINGHAHGGDPPNTIQHDRGTLSRRWDVWQRQLAPRFRLTQFLGLHLHNLLSPARAGDSSDNLVRSLWTVPAIRLPAGYGDLGVDGALHKGIQAMDQLAALLKSRGIKLSVGVYPWPDQLNHDVVDNRDVAVWREWCRANGCTRFVNHFPDFFDLKSNADWKNQVYIPGDMHLNENGAQLIADRLIEATHDLFDEPQTGHTVEKSAN